MMNTGTESQDDHDGDPDEFRSTVLGLLGLAALVAVVSIALAIMVAIESIVRGIEQLVTG